jgi:hypothetical protein
VLVQGEDLLAHAEVRQQRAGHARVLGEDRVHGVEHLERARRQVAEVADRRRHHVKVAGPDLGRRAHRDRFLDASA